MRTGRTTRSAKANRLHNHARATVTTTAEIAMMAAPRVAASSRIRSSSFRKYAFSWSRAVMLSPFFPEISAAENRFGQRRAKYQYDEKLPERLRMRLPFRTAGIRSGFRRAGISPKGQRLRGNGLQIGFAAVRMHGHQHAPAACAMHFIKS